MGYSFLYILKTICEVLTLEKKIITMTGSSIHKYLFLYFTKQHPKYKIIPNKSIGVALIELPDQFENFLSGSRMMDMRNKRNRAIKKGYVFRQFHSPDFRDEILKIHLSSRQRGGRDMAADYLDEPKVDDYLSNNPIFWGAFNKDGNLHAYIHVAWLGEICVICRLMGHKAFLSDGIMYFMISELTKVAIESKRGIKYIMYDTFFGATHGLKYFKEKSGFLPYIVKWNWKSIDPETDSQTLSGAKRN